MKDNNEEYDEYDEEYDGYEENEEYEGEEAVTDTEESYEDYSEDVPEKKKKNKKPSAAGLFFTYFFRGIVIILLLVIIALSAFLVKEILDGKKIRESKGTKVDVDESILTEEKDKTDEYIKGDKTTEEAAAENTENPNGLGDDNTLTSSKELRIAVLNATEDVEGLAGRWAAKLAEDGFTDVSPANSYMKYEVTRILVAEEGMGTDLLKYFPTASISVGSLTSDDTDADVDGVKIFIVVGNSDSDQ